jgi:hypothetical protein
MKVKKKKKKKKEATLDALLLPIVPSFPGPATRGRRGPSGAAEGGGWVVVVAKKKKESC